MDVVVPVQIKFASTSFFFMKTVGTIRFCIDFEELEVLEVQVLYRILCMDAYINLLENVAMFFILDI